MNTILLIAAGLTMALSLVVLTSHRLRTSKAWDATVTPLASIIGSGFLVSVPLLSVALGALAIPAVMALCLLAFLIGRVIRHNIAVGEDAGGDRVHRGLENAARVVLVIAYFISVPYYLSLLATFGLRLVGIIDPVPGQILATVIVVAISAVGAIRGLAAIEKAETYTVALNLSVIAGLLVALAMFGLSLPAGYSWAAPRAAGPLDGETLRFVLGLLIIVQGFETSRYMGNLYSARLRIAAMRRAQIVATAIYLMFFVLMLPLFPYFTGQADVADFIDVIARVSPILPFAVTLGAIASQFSAAVADSIGADGLISDATGGRVNGAQAYILIGVTGVGVIWLTDVIEVVALASRAFAAFYALQCMLGAWIAWRSDARMRGGCYGVLAAICLCVVIFGVPSGG